MIWASKNLKSVGANSDQNQGINIVKNACKIPAKTIANNAGEEGSIIAAKLEESNDPSFGYNALTGVFTDMFKAGVIDPKKVVRTALLDASSVASLMATTECMIVEVPKSTDAVPTPHGMGGEMF